MADEVAAQAYEEVAYPGFAFPQTRPDRLYAVARLLGLRPAPVSASRVLEIGCGDGTNLLAMAAPRRASEFLGVDASPSAITSGETLARRAGIANARFVRAEVEALPAGMGQFDYIVAHGLYSWVPPGTRSALLAACREHLSPEGVAYISYNVYPGSYLRDMAREILEFHVGESGPAQDRIAAARWLAEVIVGANVDSPHARALREQMAEVLERSDASVFHDDLAAINTPVYFHEFIANVRAHGLQYVSESDLLEGWLEGLPVSIRAALGELPGDVIVREQYLDFIKNRAFRQTLLCHEGRTVQRRLDPNGLAELALNSPLRPVSEAPNLDSDASERFQTPEQKAVETSHPLAKAALTELARAFPEALSFAEIDRRANARLADEGLGSWGQNGDLASLLLEICRTGMAELWGEPPPVASRPGERPRTSKLARAQLQVGRSTVSTLLHTNVTLEESIGRALLELLDGTRDREALLSALRELAGHAFPPQDLPDALDASLLRLGELGLLCA